LLYGRQELLRELRVVRVGLIQNSSSSGTAPFLDLKRALYQEVKPMIDSASASEVNILFLQVSHPMQLEVCILVSPFGLKD